MGLREDLTDLLNRLDEAVWEERSSEENTDNENSNVKVCHTPQFLRTILKFYT